MVPGFLKGLVTGFAEEVQITQGLLLILAIVTEIPIVMVLLARVLNYRANRWANLIGSAITIAFVSGGGSTTPHYIFFATIEVLCSGFIFWYAWTWPNPADDKRTSREIANQAG